MLAIKDSQGYVRGNAQTLSRAANVSLESTVEALRIFQSPDPDSHTPEDDGRRIEPYAGGWMILNHEKYRAREYNEVEAERKKKWREKRMSGTFDGHVPDPSASASVSVSVLEEGVKGESKPEAFGDDGWELDFVVNIATSPDCGVRPEIAQSCFDHYAAGGWVDANGRQVGRTINSLKSLLRRWATREQSFGKRDISTPTPAEKKPPKANQPHFDDLVQDVCRDLWEHRGDDQGFKRSLSVWRDKTKDIPKRDGKTVIDEALEILKFQKAKGRDKPVSNAWAGILVGET